MKSWRAIVIAAALGLLNSGIVLHSDDGMQSQPGSGSGPDGTGSSSASTGPARPVPSVDAALALNLNLSLPLGPLSDDLQKLIDTANKARTDFYKEQVALRNSLLQADRDLRSRLRANLQAQRETFLMQQRDAREQLRNKVNALRERLKDHQDAIDQAKDQGKERAHVRKDD